MSLVNKIQSLLNSEISFKGNAKKQPVKQSNSKSNEKIKKKREVKTIRTLENVPSFRRIISLGDDNVIPEDQKESIIQFTQKLKQDYIVLDISKPGAGEKRAAILSSIEISNSIGVDNNYLGIRKKCLDKGYRSVAKEYASREIIQLLYTKNTKKKSDDSVSDDDGALVKKFDDMLIEAVENEVSDLHIEVEGDDSLVRHRINGQLKNVDTWDSVHALKMAQVIYTVVAEEKDVTFNPSEQQAAIINRELLVPGEGNIRVRVRLNTIPAYPSGFNVVMRILKMGKAGTKLTFDMLGYSFDQIEGIKESIAKPVGCTIISGTTGSGKSTSLSVMLTRLVNENLDVARTSCSIKIITVEDPPEYEVPHVTQSPVVRSKSKDENPFSAAIKAAMRCDPDVLMVGEVRDEHSAELLVHAVQSGHQAFTTVHAPSALGIVPRLRSLGVSNDVLGNDEFIAGLVYQALLPVLCNECKVSMETYVNKVKGGEYFVEDKFGFDQLIERLDKITMPDEKKNIFFKNPCGCSECDKTGISGRTVAAEVIVPDLFMIDCFFEGNDTKAKEHYKKKGGEFALDHGITKMLDGRADPRDVEKKLGRVTGAVRLSKIESLKNGSAELENPVLNTESDLFNIEDSSSAENVSKGTTVISLTNKKGGLSSKPKNPKLNQNNEVDESEQNNNESE
ncbi:GspE/PulE family protein [Vibrio parahaemolyticus]|uniref:GspE/PulE family protein n=1 Tax=Vibrio parahaemolyticus TaxID=670 RepID=UPI00226ADA48|nr:ATPase, T2SS/T4P/T4SS family [Vibrio parahaemolyticus]MCX8796211.1 Flp pilus assembly complex ATPase component TadA [Vibrio parahaemolyticus]